MDAPRQGNANLNKNLDEAFNIQFYIKFIPRSRLSNLTPDESTKASEIFRVFKEGSLEEFYAACSLQSDKRLKDRAIFIGSIYHKESLFRKAHPDIFPPCKQEFKKWLDSQNFEKG